MNASRERRNARFALTLAIVAFGTFGVLAWLNGWPNVAAFALVNVVASAALQWLYRPRNPNGGRAR